MKKPSIIARQILNETFAIRKYYCTRCDLFIDGLCAEHRNIVKCHRKKEVIENESKSNKGIQD